MEAPTKTEIEAAGGQYNVNPGRRRSTVTSINMHKNLDAKLEQSTLLKVEEFAKKPAQSCQSLG